MDAVALLKHDHRMVEQLFRDYDAAKSDVQRRGVVEVMVRELSKHAALEEVTVYPFAKEFIDDGFNVDGQLSEHLEVKQTLAALDALPQGDEREQQLIRELQERVSHHVEDEEGHFLPALARALDDQALDELGSQLDQAKKVAPTRPHPSAPDEPPALTLAAPFVAIYDRFRDRVQGRPTT